MSMLMRLSSFFALPLPLPLTPEVGAAHDAGLGGAVRTNGVQHRRVTQHRVAGFAREFDNLHRYAMHFDCGCH